MKKTMVSAAVLASAALALPVLAQSDANDTNGDSSYDMMDETNQGTTTSVGAETDTDTDADLDVSTSASSVSSSSQSSAATSVGADTDEDTDGDTTVPDELPDTGGGWGAGR